VELEVTRKGKENVKGGKTESFGERHKVYMGASQANGHNAWTSWKSSELVLLGGIFR